jgi:hypothetical protein
MLKSPGIEAIVEFISGWRNIMTEGKINTGKSGLAVAAVLFASCVRVWAAGPDVPVGTLVPEIEGWALADAPQEFAPDSLYEYIDGAAESYLAYEFKALTVAQFQKPGTEASMTVEIYDMGSPLNAFGIYSVERYPENRIVAAGAQGYIEDEVLNFFVGKYYVKLVCFNGGVETARVLEGTAAKVAAKAGPGGALPAFLSVFPREGLVVNSEKYIRRNVLGFDFLRGGYLASYKHSAGEFECFALETEAGQNPDELGKKLLEFFKKDGQSVEKIPMGHRIRNRYSQQMIIAVEGRYLCGVNRVPDAAESAGETCLQSLIAALKGWAHGRQ